jgi:hypothetical protein
VDLDDRFLVRLNLASERDLLFASGEDEVIAVALESAISDLSAQMRYWKNGGNYESTIDFEVF